MYDNLPEAVKHLLAGYPGVEVIMARRKGDIWYIAGINGINGINGTNEPRTLHVSFEDIPVRGKKMSLFKDDTDDRNFAIEENIPLPDRQADLEIGCLPRGGFVVVIQ